MRFSRLNLRWVLLSVAMLITAAVTTSCGGGGGGGGGSSSGGSGGASGTYSLSGTVTDSNSNGIANVTVTLDGNSSIISNTTTANGVWAINNIPASAITSSASHQLIVTYLGTGFPNTLPPFAAGSTSETGLALTVNTPPVPPGGV